jgi:membrane protease YdiL (CAAX protease family)
MLGMEFTPISLMEDVGKILILGVPVWLWLGWRWRNTGILLSMEPRRPVPWEGVDVLLVMAVFFLAEFCCMGVGLRLAGGELSSDLQHQSVGGQLIGFACDAVARLATLCIAVVVLTRRVQATTADLGFVKSKAPFDVICGTIAFAAIVPIVYAVQIVTQALIAPYEHPLITAVEHHRQPMIWIVVTLSAVIVAPLTEEFFFRGLLQGWLEKIELAYCEKNGFGEKVATVASSASESTATLPAGSANSPRVRRGLLNLPLGTLPIFYSSMLFALTHLGQGAAQIPLFVLALAMGFLYQRTHRLLPSVTVHFLLNAITMAMLFANG